MPDDNKSTETVLFSKKRAIVRRVWFHRLMSAAVGGACAGGGAMFARPDIFNLGKGLDDLIHAVEMGAIIGVMVFLRGTPAPPLLKEEVKLYDENVAGDETKQIGPYYRGGGDNRCGGS